MPKNKKSSKISKSSVSATVAKNPRYLRRRRVSPLKFAFWLVLALLAGFVAYMMYRFIFDRSFDLPISAAESKESSEEKSSKDSKDKTLAASEKETSEDSKESESPAPSKTPTQNDGEDPNISASLTGSLTSINVSGSSLVLRVNIDQYLSSGTCSLTLSSGSSVVEKSAAILPTVATSSCEGFDVPLSELGSGAWKIEINLTSGDRVGKITGSVDL